MDAPLPTIDPATLVGSCRPSRGADTCRYLGCQGSGWKCLKHDTVFRIVIDGRVEEGTMTARGDNCPGLKAES